MKFRLEVDEDIDQDEIVIRCKNIDENILEVQEYINQILSRDLKIYFYKNTKEYYFSVDQVLFFESSQDKIVAHTLENLYTVKFKLYELEEVLAGNFIRISKSTIVNLRHIFSVDKNIASASVVEFNNCHKKVYISRRYFNDFKNRLEKVRG